MLSIGIFGAYYLQSVVQGLPDPSLLSPIVDADVHLVVRDRGRSIREGLFAPTTSCQDPSCSHTKLSYFAADNTCANSTRSSRPSIENDLPLMQTTSSPFANAHWTRMSARQ
jgi:hypothetical protein